MMVLAFLPCFKTGFLCYCVGWLACFELPESPGLQDMSAMAHGGQSCCYRSWFSPSAMWNLVTEFRFSGLAAWVICAILTAQLCLALSEFWGLELTLSGLWDKHYYPPNHLANSFCLLRLPQNVVLVHFELVMYTRVTLNLQ